MNPRYVPIAAALLVMAAATIEALVLQRVHGSYDWRAFFASAGDAALRTALILLPLHVGLAALNAIYAHRLHTMPMHTVGAWVLLIIGQDFCYYWMHRADHRVRFMWATHSVHHSPTDLNLSAAYRLGFTSRLSVAPLFFAPLVLAGFPPLPVAAALSLNLLYQFWLHATWIPRLGPLEWVFNTPSHHRVHHASNAEYLDRNFGGVFIVFDRIFGSFRAERAGLVIRYGLTRPIAGYNALLIGTAEWRALGRDLLAARSLRDVVACAIGPPK